MFCQHFTPLIFLRRAADSYITPQAEILSVNRTCCLRARKGRGEEGGRGAYNRMLAANRDQLVANLQAGAQDLRWRELDSVSGRYAGMVGVTSLGAGFAFSAMVELELPENPSPETLRWIYAFYLLITVALVLSLYVVAFSAMSISAGNRLALQGNEKSTTRAVAILLVNFRNVFIGALLVLLCIIGAAMCIVFIKLQDNQLEELTGALFVAGCAFILFSLHRLKQQLEIRKDEMVTGAVTVGSGGNMVDLTQVHVVHSDDRARLHDGSFPSNV